LVESLLLLLALLRLVVSHASSLGLLPGVGLRAAKGATQIRAPRFTPILAPRIASIGEKEDPTMPASLQASSQVGLCSDDQSQNQVILQDQSPDLRPSIPVSRKLKMLRDLDCKKTKLSLRMLTLKWMSPSYPNGTPVSSAVGRGFSFPIALHHLNRLFGKKKLRPLLQANKSIYLSTLGSIYPSAIELERIQVQPSHQRGIGIVAQPLDIPHAGEEQVERPGRVLTAEEVIFLD
jgi:hypothetical protein